MVQRDVSNKTRKRQTVSTPCCDFKCWPSRSPSRYSITLSHLPNAIHCAYSLWIILIMIVETKNMIHTVFFIYEMMRDCAVSFLSKPVKSKKKLLWSDVLSIAISDIVNMSFLHFFSSNYFFFHFVNNVRAEWIKSIISAAIS